MRRLYENKKNRDFVRTIIRNDWKIICDFDNNTFDKLLTKILSTIEKIIEWNLDLKLLTISQLENNKNINLKRRRQKNSIDNLIFRNDNEINERDFSISQSIRRSIKKLREYFVDDDKTINFCVCEKISIMLIKRIFKKIANKTTMRHNHEILRFVYKLLKTIFQRDLSNVCRRYLKIVKIFLKLKMNNLRTQQLRYRFK